MFTTTTQTRQEVKRPVVHFEPRCVGGALLPFCLVLGSLAFALSAVRRIVMGFLAAGRGIAFANAHRCGTIRWKPKGPRVCLVFAGIALHMIVVVAPFPLAAKSLWYPFQAEVPAAGKDTPEKKTIAYVPLDKAERKWSLCVSFPHMKDSYWLAVNFGVVSEAKRLGVQMRLVQAGGYDNLPMQIEQIRQCVKEGAEGVIIGAISFNGLDKLVSELKAQGIPVIDLVNGICSNEVSARSLVSFGEMGYRAGEFIARQHPKGSKPVRVAWFPGPEEAGWVKDGDKGFRSALADSAAEIVAVRYGDTGVAAQTALLNEVLDAHPDIDLVAGTAVTAKAAVRTLRIRGLSDRIGVMAYYLTPEVYREIKRGRILGAPTDSPVIQGRIAVDQLVRILEHKPYQEKVGPRIYVIDRSTISTFNRSTSLAPSGFRATYSVNIRRMIPR